jgi:hypothetical protein
VAALKFAEYPYIAAISQAELGRGKAAVPLLLELEARNPTRLKDFAEAARTLIEGNNSASTAVVRRILMSGFGDPEALFYLARHLAHVGEAGTALVVLERVVAGGFFCHPAMAHDPWLAPLVKKPAFARLLKQAESQHVRARAEFERLGGDKVLGVATAG